MEKTLKDLLKLALNFKTMSEEVNGWETKDYGLDDGVNDCYVRCYFSNNQDYSSIAFGGGSVGDFEVSFFDPPVFSFDNRFATNKGMNDLLIKYRKFYNKLRRQLKIKTRREREQERLAKIKILESELKNLKNKK